MTNRGAFKGVPDEELRRLYIDENLSADEIAEIYHTTANAVRSHLSHLGIKKGRELAQKSQERINMQKYGVKSTLQLQEVKDKVKETLQREYGTDNVLKLKEFQEKAKDTLEKKYGVRDCMKSEEIRNRAKETWVKNYGVDNPGKSVEVFQKRVETLEEKYGVDNPMKNEEIVKKQRKAKSDGLKARTGVGFLNEIPREELERLYIQENRSAQEIADMFGRNVFSVMNVMSQNGIYKDRSMTEAHRKETSLLKYGTAYPVALNGKNKEVLADVLKKRMGEDYPVDMVLDKDSFVAFLDSLDEPYTTIEIAELSGLSYTVILNTIKKFGLKDHPKILFLSASSSQEREIYSWLESLGFTVQRNVYGIVPKYELDIYIPDKKFGIEFNGNYWHSEQCRDRKYHQNKSLLGKENGVFVYHIFEYEWEDEKMKEKIKNHLLAILGVGGSVIYARDCEVKEISIQEKAKFLEENHLQGDDRSSVRYGLYHNGELVSVMTFGRPRFNQKYKWEIHRYCSKSGVRVVGGASRLFKHFLGANDGSIVSYSNFAKMSGNMYKMLGFTNIGLSKPGYVWYKRGEVLSRFQTQMKDEIKTMHENGYSRIYDCGNEVWEYIR